MAAWLGWREERMSGHAQKTHADGARGKARGPPRWSEAPSARLMRRRQRQRHLGWAGMSRVSRTAERQGQSLASHRAKENKGRPLSCCQHEGPCPRRPSHTHPSAMRQMPLLALSMFI